jgi:putative ATPase
MNSTRPLAYRVRPKSLDEIVGQDHLIGPNGIIRKMIERKKLFSLILYGPPGIGKTTIAEVIGAENALHTYKFNASTDSKTLLVKVIEESKNYGALLIVDEIHRMNKNIQDFLLPHVENGNIILVGLTTNNPYHSVNPAVRSRCHVLKLKPISKEKIIFRLKMVLTEYKDELRISLNDDVYDYIALLSNNEIRSAINALELLSIAYSGKSVDIDMTKDVLLQPSLSLDKNEDNYFDILSAFQKSIRGSDVDAALHYLARLIAMEDLQSILRRMSVIAYEDIGLANPGIVSRMDACANACERLGFPEARIPLSMLVIDMALSPKSNSAVVAIDNALKDVMKGKTPKIPSHIINVENFDDKKPYLYPHDYEDALIYQQYLPDELQNTHYYKGKKTGKYERALFERYTMLKKILHKEKDDL